MGTIALAIGLSTLLFAYDEKGKDCKPFCSDETVWELRYMGQKVAGDMTESECKELLDEIEMQTEPFSHLSCVEIGVNRQEI